MGEALIARGGSASGGGSNGSDSRNWTLKTEIINQNAQYIIPACRNQEISVRIFGGGGGGTGQFTPGMVGGGGGGWMNNAIFNNLNAGQTVQIHIGHGGTKGTSSTFPNGASGGTTTFGSLLSANGGDGATYNYNMYRGGACGGNGGAGGGGCSRGGTGFQFGGGGCADIYHNERAAIAGDGGRWGGGGAVCVKYNNSSVIHANAIGGNGGYYGGGGAGSWAGGYGGMYGGSAGSDGSQPRRGGAVRQDENNSKSQITSYSGLGGSGANSRHGGGNGTDTTAKSDIFNDGNTTFNGRGYGGNNYGGGGGYGGNGGSNIGGGGGYGSNGGHDFGGGGGFGGDGGDNCGGGGGYGKTARGGDGQKYEYLNGAGSAGGGGGYYGAGGRYGGGGGAYGNGGDGYSTTGRVAASMGGGGGSYTDGADGICIIQYYVKE